MSTPSSVSLLGVGVRDSDEAMGGIQVSNSMLGCVPKKTVMVELPSVFSGSQSVAMGDENSELGSGDGSSSRQLTQEVLNYTLSKRSVGVEELPNRYRSMGGVIAVGVPSPLIVEYPIRKVRIKLSWDLMKAVLLFIVSLFLQGQLILCAERFYSPADAPLKDRLHDSLDPPDSNASVVISALFAAAISISIIRFSIFYHWKAATAVFHRFFTVMSILYLVRGVFIVLTSVPSPIPFCSPIIPVSLLDSFKAIFYIGIGIYYSCSDLIISGHTLLINTLIFGWFYYSRKQPIPVCIFAILGYALLPLLILSYFHYTIDVLFGLFFSTTAWLLYHLLLDIAAAKYKHKIFKHPDNMFNHIPTIHPIINFLSGIVAYWDGLEFRINSSLASMQHTVNTNQSKESPLISTDSICRQQTTQLEEFVSDKTKFLHTYYGTLDFDFYLFTSLFRTLRNAWYRNSRRPPTPHQVQDVPLG